MSGQTLVALGAALGVSLGAAPGTLGRRVRRVRPAAAGLALAALTLGAPPAAAQIDPYLIDTGPLRVRDQFLLGMGFLAFDPASADVMDEGEWQVDLIATATNHFGRSDSVAGVLESRANRGSMTLDELRAIEPAEGDGGTFLVDGEVYRTIFAARRGVGRRLQVEVVVPVLSFQGGFVDGLVERFHSVFGFEQEGRLGAIRDEFTVYARNREDELYVSDEPSLTLGDVVFGARYRLKLPNGGPLRLAVETQLKLPTGDPEPIATSGSVDLGVQLLATRYLSRSCVHASIGALALGSSKRLGLSSQIVLSGMAAYELSLGEASSALLQVTLSQSPFHDLDLEGLDRSTIQVTVGLKKVVGDGVMVVGITENFGAFNNTPDVGFHIGITRRFPGRRGGI